MKVCAVVPVYNHSQPALRVIAGLRELGLRCIVVDDGSSGESARLLDEVAMLEGVTLLRHTRNQGKGAAVMSGLRHAGGLGCSHALQIDADGQHDIADVPRLLAAAADDQRAMIVGNPVYDATVPRVRYYGRYATHVWVWINTLSRRIRDSMCGLRVYPLESTLALLDGAGLGRRMEFDIEVLVRLDWHGVRIVNVPVTVRYPEQLVSHFRLGRDNLLIASMHARLFVGMLPRAPLLLRRSLHRAR